MISFYQKMLENPWQTIEIASIIILLVNVHFLQKRLLFIESLTHQHRSDQLLIEENQK